MSRAFRLPSFLRAQTVTLTVIRQRLEQKRGSPAPLSPPAFSPVSSLPAIPDCSSPTTEVVRASPTSVCIALNPSHPKLLFNRIFLVKDKSNCPGGRKKYSEVIQSICPGAEPLPFG